VCHNRVSLNNAIFFTITFEKFYSIASNLLITLGMLIFLVLVVVIISLHCNFCLVTTIDRNFLSFFVWDTCFIPKILISSIKLVQTFINCESFKCFAVRKNIVAVYFLSIFICDFEPYVSIAIEYCV
jgi:hypothetical protein